MGFLSEPTDILEDITVFTGFFFDLLKLTTGMFLSDISFFLVNKEPELMATAEFLT